MHYLHGGLNTPRMVPDDTGVTGTRGLRVENSRKRSEYTDIQLSMLK